MKDIDEYLLTTNVTVGQLKFWINQKDDISKAHIIDFINHRFSNRYLKHLTKIDSGFLQMAICCLTIETLECFKQGRENTIERGAGKEMFKSFFESEKHNFPGFISIYEDFYYSIRCGILHQAETNNGWRIRRDGKLLDLSERSIDSVQFVKALKNSLEEYLTSLTNQDIGSALWEKAIAKLITICNHCKVSS